MAAKKQEKQKPETLELRDILNELIGRELDHLPELLEGLQGKDRLAAILKLMPLVIPKTEPVRYNINELNRLSWWWVKSYIP